MFKLVEMVLVLIFGKSIGKFSWNGIELGKTKQVTVRCSLKQVVFALENLQSMTSTPHKPFGSTFVPPLYWIGVLWIFGKFSWNGMELAKTKQVTVCCSLKQVVFALENLTNLSEVLLPLLSPLFNGLDNCGVSVNLAEMELSSKRRSK